ncbi:MAG: 4-alpha-glucanotransferase [Phycisphaerae bacterium]|nr:4-alpha-glucanotransferase [Phycisphaerae bacterium]
MIPKPSFRLSDRAGGLLLHPTSLPGPHGCGDLGPEAYHFVDFLAAAGQRWWQMLPINPVGPGGSPYSALSAFAGNPLLISLTRLAEEGLLSKPDIKPVRGLKLDRVRYGAVTRFRTARLWKAFDAFVRDGGLTSRVYLRFCKVHADWLDDDALFSALRRAHDNKSWITWNTELRLRRKAALRKVTDDLRDEIDFERFLQFQFDRQWSDLRKYAHDNGVGLIGDIPIFVAHDSSDVWARRALFDLDASGRVKTVSGVPPDLFSRDGQRWGHPQYRWRRHRTTGFAWWLARFRRAFAQFDAVRIDHFLGFQRVWAVPGRAKTARRGKWIKTPGAELFSTVRRKLGRLEIIAEDLGVVTPEAVALRERFGLPGIRLLHFAFGNDEGDRYNQPHTYPRNCVVYPGTHDNETTVGWFERLRREHRRQRHRTQMTEYERVLRYLGTSGRKIHWDIIRLALSSPANTAIIPVQDLLGLDNAARMNTPATTAGNWQWRLVKGRLTARLARQLHGLTDAYGRLPVSGGSSHPGDEPRASVRAVL